MSDPDPIPTARETWASESPNRYGSMLRKAFEAGFSAASPTLVWVLWNHGDQREMYATRARAEARAADLVARAKNHERHTCSDRCYETFSVNLLSEAPSWS